MAPLKLKSSDSDELFTVEQDIIRCSLTIKTMLEDLGMEDGDEEVIPLPNVTAAILSKVIEWATHHKVNFIKSLSTLASFGCTITLASKINYILTFFYF